jgi:uncharacterized repeat protein (TIGR03806 family)
MDQPPALLSQTGCMDPARPTMIAASVLQYEVNSPLWSDGADKTRGMSFPADAKIHVKNCATTPAECPQGPADDGKWVMPVGTVMVKSFLFDGKLVETRLFVHFDATTWAGYSYKWNEAQTDATIVADERVEFPFNTGQRSVTWRIPSRLDCTSCHVPEAGSTLGPETAQMNRMVGGTNQIDRWIGMGLFDVSPATPYKTALPNPLSAQAGTVERRARSYMHANCGFCHRPADGAPSAIDLRYDVTFKDTNTCGATPEKGDQGVAGALIVEAGQPNNSVLLLRMLAPPEDMNGRHGRMPRIASYVVDTAAVELIEDWIGSVTACPQ